MSKELNAKLEDFSIADVLRLDRLCPDEESTKPFRDRAKTCRSETVPALASSCAMRCGVRHSKIQRHDGSVYSQRSVDLRAGAVGRCSRGARTAIEMPEERRYSRHTEWSDVQDKANHQTGSLGLVM